MPPSPMVCILFLKQGLSDFPWATLQLQILLLPPPKLAGIISMYYMKGYLKGQGSFPRLATKQVPSKQQLQGKSLGQLDSARVH
jgi:hypothetical protein